MNREIQILRDVITKLVPLLTGKGLKVTQRGTKAYVQANPKTNKPEVVNIPSIPDNATPDFINAVSGFVDHEVGHVLFTDWKVYGGDGVAIDKFSDEGQSLINFHNMIEDVFVERQIVKAFPGAEFNLDRLHQHFLAKITAPAVESAKGNKEAEFSYLMVPMIRALSGQEVFEDFMTKNGYWEHELVKNLLMSLSRDSLDLIKTARSTAETLIPAQEIYDILFVRKKREEEKKKQQQRPQPPQPPKSQPPEEEEQEASQPSESDEETQSQDKPEKKAEEGDGDGERDHDDQEADDAGAKSEEADDGEEDGASGSGKSDADESEDENESAGSGSSKEDDDERSEDGKAEEEAEEVEDGKAEEEAEEGDDEKSDGDDGDTDGDEEEGEYEDYNRDEKAADEEESGGGGFGGQSGESMFDLDPSTFKPVDLSSAIAQEIHDMAKQAVDEADYSVFTKDDDQIRIFETPDSIDAKWVPEMDDRVMSLVGPMQKDIERMMASQSRVIRTSGHRSGKLHSASLHRVLQGDARVFQRKEESRSKDTAVMLLVDNSGSMSGPRIITAMQSAYALAVTLERVGIPSEIMGFTTGYASRQVCLQADEEMRKGIRFSRTTTTIVMPVFKTFAERVTPIVKRRIAYQLNMQVGMNVNIDGESLEYGAARLLPRRESRKVMIVLSDGSPVGSGTGPHLKKVVNDLGRIGIETVGIGIQSNAVKNFYPRSLVLNDVKDLPGAVMGELKRILTT